jgi:hypothetical protein
MQLRQEVVPHRIRIDPSRLCGRRRRHGKPAHKEAHKLRINTGWLITKMCSWRGDETRAAA